MPRIYLNIHLSPIKKSIASAAVVQPAFSLRGSQQSHCRSLLVTSEATSASSAAPTLEVPYRLLAMLAQEVLGFLHPQLQEGRHERNPTDSCPQSLGNPYHLPVDLSQLILPLSSPRDAAYQGNWYFTMRVGNVCYCKGHARRCTHILYILDCPCL